MEYSFFRVVGAARRHDAACCIDKGGFGTEQLNPKSVWHSHCDARAISVQEKREQVDDQLDSRD
jgi:hypothetical protein